MQLYTNSIQKKRQSNIFRTLLRLILVIIYIINIENI